MPCDYWVSIPRCILLAAPISPQHSANEKDQIYDFYHWSAILRSVSAFEIYRKDYRDVIRPERVAELLILRPDMPQSLQASMVEVLSNLKLVSERQDTETLRLTGKLGITPGPGGQHPLMGTHNRLFSIASAAYPQAYFEIIAIDPGATPPARTRWFDMDDAALRERVQRQGPQLAHFVARVPDATAAVAALHAQGIERGAVLQAERATSHGLLQWQITVRDDGQRLYDGTLPTLIQWGAVHPSEAMPASGITLEQLTVQHPQAEALADAYRAIGLDAVAVQPGPAQLQARLLTPRGPVLLAS